MPKLSTSDLVTDSTGSTGLAAIKITALGRPNLLVSPSRQGGLGNTKQGRTHMISLRTMGEI